MEESSKNKKSRETNVEEHFYDFSKSKLIRIEYPGNVKHIEDAMKTLGGLSAVTKAVVEDTTSMELSFHPKNFFNKPCIADNDDNVGFLIKIRKDRRNSGEPNSYEVIGATATNFEFNRMCDFQYLPLTEKKVENSETTAEYIHDKIFIRDVPTMEWFTKKETAQLPVFSIPPGFSRYDTPTPQIGLKSGELFGSIVRPECTFNWARTMNPMHTKKNSIVYNHIVNFLKINLNKIPEEPYPEALQLIKEKKFLQIYYDKIARLFDERPIWSKPAIIHITELRVEQLRYVLPAVAYYCSAGPWKSSWIRLGYNPTKDPSSRIYQVLDYRLRHDGSQTVKIRAKRQRVAKNEFVQPNNSLGERGYILKPGWLPPARQMCYQFCDILLPEVQELIIKLPKLSQTTKYDLKNGWLSLLFIEQIRDIVSAYVKSRIHEEFIQEAHSKRIQFDLPGTSKETEKECGSVVAQSSRILSNISKGVYQRPNLDLTLDKDSRSVIDLETESVMEDRHSDIDDLEEDIVDSLPERMETENLSENSDSDSEVGVIDLEAVEEINNLIGNL